jgi:hypothetical protein
LTHKYKLWLEIEKISNVGETDEDYDRVSPLPEYDISFDTLAAAEQAVAQIIEWWEKYEGCTIKKQ